MLGRLVQEGQGAGDRPIAGSRSQEASPCSAPSSHVQALRPVLAPRSIAVHGVYPGGIDTDMLAGIDAPKTAPERVAAGILDGLAEGREDIFPDPNAQAMARTWWSDPKSFERAFSGAAAA